MHLKNKMGFYIMEINSLRKNIREREREERTYLALHLFEGGEERLFGGFSVKPDGSVRAVLSDSASCINWVLPD